MESWNTILSMSKAKKFKGGPGTAGIIHPASPKIERTNPIIIVSVSISLEPSFWAIVFLSHNIFLSFHKHQNNPALLPF